MLPKQCFLNVFDVKIQQFNLYILFTVQNVGAATINNSQVLKPYMIVQIIEKNAHYSSPCANSEVRAI